VYQVNNLVAFCGKPMGFGEFLPDGEAFRYCCR